MNDFVLMLTATLHLSPGNIIHDSSESTDSDKTIIENRIWSSGDRTIAEPLHETNRLYQRCQLFRE
jgi:hypothetical protein